MSEPANEKNFHAEGCLICGKPLIYHTSCSTAKCEICGEPCETDVYCEDGHFVCDNCHSEKAVSLFTDFMLNCTEKDPIKIFDAAIDLPGVHMHGPEHHFLISMSLLTAYKNNGGDIDLEEALRTAAQRAGNVPGGICGFWGACGSGVCSGIFASIVLGSTPVNGKVWHLPQKLTAECLNANAEIGGPRCCKRTCRTAIRTAAEYSTNVLGVPMEASMPVCGHMKLNHECIGSRCPYFPKKSAD